ncbi:TOG array regulator of axonemal microtubules protein 2 [Rana temporaria]|uniref:TOG array regulator of axonemal microtubules protein 2 n=1 Tax=Rana temporaria TaxID=8407 RepID=UPI001AAD26A6|nr:TOG array regulator of axonemal microtubules protein 2 [Rana temporaria]XP_040207795.1 TOG array regulator of axonemal microtubules protein 2 [Rana temporaria]
MTGSPTPSRMTHNDYTAAKFRAPIAVYCGSVPKMKPGGGFASLRNGDSNLQLYGNRWAGADPAALQPSLSLQMKRSYLWGGDDLQTDILPPPLDLEGKSDPLFRNQRREEVDSAALETARLKDKLKRKMSESSSARGAPTEFMNSVNSPLRPAVPRSASQRLMTVTKPVPPIQRSPTPRLGTPEEDGVPRNPPEDGGERVGGQTEKTPAITENLRSGAEKKRKSLGGIVIPPISKSSNFPADQIGNDGATRHTGDSPRSAAAAHRSFASEPENDKISGADQAESRHITSVESDLDPIPSNPVFPTPPPDGGELKDDEGKENYSRVSVSISKSAQDKMRQRQQEMETIRSQRRRSQQQLWERLQGVETGGESVSVTSFTLSNTVPISAEKRRGGANVANNIWVSRPSLPSIPTIPPEPSVSDFRHSSAFSLPASLLDLSEGDVDSENSAPMSHPEQGLIEALRGLNHKDWEQKEKGLLSVRCLASWHPEVLCSRIHDVCMAVTREVSNLRSKVSRHAIKTISDLFRSLRRNVDQEAEEITRVMLHKIGDSNDFIRDEADKSLGMMVENVTPSRAMCALIAGGGSHRNSAVRKCTAKHLLRVVELLGAEKLLCGSRESTDSFLRTLVRLVQDGQQDTRFYGRRMFSLVMAHPKFEVQMERLIPSHELRDLIATVKQKELRDSISEIPSARSQRPPQKNSAVVRAQDAQQPEESITRPAEAQEPEAQESPVPRKTPVRAAEVTEQLKELSKLLSAKEYQSKMDGVTLLLEHCKNNAKFVASNITPIFDAFNPRMQDANKKVNQHALESAAAMIPILKDSLHHVLVPMVTVITDNLNSKHAGIYTAAVTVLDTLMKNIDNLWLLQPFASRIRFLSGRAMSDVTERLSGLVSSVYPRKPQAVERHVLPVLWFFLSNITGNGVLPGRNGNFKDVVTKLTKNLHQVMGRSLEEYASGQSQHAAKMLADILGTNK